MLCSVLSFPSCSVVFHLVLFCSVLSFRSCSVLFHLVLFCSFFSFLFCSVSSCSVQFSSDMFIVSIMLIVESSMSLLWHIERNGIEGLLLSC